MLFAALVLLAAVASASGVSAQPGPHLRIVAHSPLSLRGQGFKPGERVTLRVTLGHAAAKRHVTATAEGAFTSTFSSVSLDGCKALHVEAAGSKGSRVSFSLETTQGCTGLSTK
jgi:hypothetical protein